MKQYNKLLSDISITLKKHGFNKKKNTFYVIKEGNYGLINFQKSRGSTKSNIVFTIDIGIACNKLIEVLNERKDYPRIEDCHWRRRIGFLLDCHRDHWWEINDNTDIIDMTLDIVDVLTKKAIPEIIYYLDIENLKKLWLEGRSDGLTDLQRAMNLLRLLKYDKDDIEPVIEALKTHFKGKSSERSFNIFLEEGLFAD